MFAYFMKWYDDWTTTHMKQRRRLLQMCIYVHHLASGTSLVLVLLLAISRVVDGPFERVALGIVIVVLVAAIVIEAYRANWVGSGEMLIEILPVGLTTQGFKPDFEVRWEDVLFAEVFSESISLVIRNHPRESHDLPLGWMPSEDRERLVELVTANVKHRAIPPPASNG